MKVGWEGLAILAGFAMECAALAVEPVAVPEAPTPPEASAPLLTLGSPLLRSTMDRMNLAWMFPQKIPDFRLKVDRPDWESMTTAGMENRFRGVEIRLPVEGLWVGYETATESEEPRATFSIQRGF